MAQPRKTSLRTYLLAILIAILLPILAILAGALEYFPNIRAFLSGSDYYHVNQHFASYDEAVAGHALHAGSFMPPCTPRSATDIHDIHNADTNTGHGSFRFDPDNAGDLRASLIGTELSISYGQPGAPQPTSSEQACRFQDHFLLIDWQAGTCEWVLDSCSPDGSAPAPAPG